MSTLAHLNYLHVLVAAIVGFLIGWVWFSMLFGKVWMAEKKPTPEQMEAGKKKMGGNMVKGFISTFVSTVGLAMVLAAAAPGIGWAGGAKWGVAVGLLIAGARYYNTSVWEGTSCKLQTIMIAHEVVMFAVQGAILASWMG